MAAGRIRKPNTYRIEGDTAYIRLDRRDGQSFEAMVDVDDLKDVLAATHWGCHRRGYAQGGANGSTILLHRFVMQPPDGCVVDHINHNELDNRRSNLAVVAQRANCQNRREAGNTKAAVAHRNVYLYLNKYNVKIKPPAKDKAVWLGAFDTLEEAIAVARYGRRLLSFHGCEYEPVDEVPSDVAATICSKLGFVDPPGWSRLTAPVTIDCPKPGRPKRKVVGVSDRDIEIIVARLRGETLAQIGERYMMSRERIRQICLRAAARLGLPEDTSACR